MKYYTDGFVIGHNPSEEGGGYTIFDENNVLIKREVVYKSNFTNNEAEILGILEALKLCSKGDTISTDSMCCLTWANAGWSKARPELLPVLKECKELKTLKQVNLCWEGRDFNLAGIYNENNPIKGSVLYRKPKVKKSKDWKMFKDLEKEFDRQQSFLNSL